ncbi:MAG TPA: DUF58 domain-containing protein, partial [Gemmataceae bacterium]|nr:DUF58 domain-containing protein [Gemmataceae bacterium]
MQPTRLTVCLFAAGFIPFPTAIALALFGSNTTWIYFLVFGFDAGLVLLLFGDALLGSRGHKLKITREKPPRLSVGVDNEVTLLIENRGRRRLDLFVRDETPPGFKVEPPLLQTSVPPRGWVRLAYRLLPTERGNFRFGNVHVRLRCPLRLAWIDTTLDAEEDVLVYPNLLEVRRYEAMVRTTLVRTGGYHIKRLPGASKEFSHFREYTVDDDYRHVNWKATARRAKPITSVFESERSQDIIFCLDAGRMMAARVGTLTKLDHAINAV